jgi:hypothetical protein
MKANPSQRLNLPFSEAQLLKGFSRRTAHADALADLLSSEVEKK